MKTIFYLCAVVSLHLKWVAGGGTLPTSEHHSENADFVMVDIPNPSGDEVEEDNNNVKLFKTYVLPLMQAVFTQYAKGGKSLVKKGVECARNIKNEQALPSLILILKSMTIASTQSQCLDIIHQSRTVSEAQSKLLDATVNDIRELMNVVLSDSGLVLQLISLDESVVEKYIEEQRVKPSEPKIATFFQNSDQADKCYQLMAGIEHNIDFFQQYLNGFAAIRHRMNENGVEIAGIDDNSRSQTLSEIIERIGKIGLKNPPQWKQVRVFQQKMSPFSFFVSVSLYFIFGLL